MGIIQSWKHFIELFILLYLAYQLKSLQYDDDYPSANKFTSWMNNDLSAVNTAQWNLFDVTPISFMRVILLKAITNSNNDRVGFACGFVSNPENESFLAIGSIRWSYEQESWYSLEILWLANRNQPVHLNAKLQLLPEVGLMLTDVDGTLVWSSNTSNMNVVGMQMMETGNLVLHDDRNKTVWQSFDHPTHTLLPGQKLITGQKLVAHASATDWREGSFYLSVTSQGLSAIYQSSVPHLYFSLPIYRTKHSGEPSYVKFVNGTLAVYIFSAEPSAPDAMLSSPVNYSAMAYMRFDYDGHFRLYDDSMNDTIDLLADHLEECDYPTVCGNFGVCSKGECSCPPGFAQNDYGIGCTEISQTTCEDTKSQSLLTLDDVYYFNYVDFGAADLKVVSMESCKEACLKNCSCKAALFQYYFDDPYGYCFFPSPVLSLIHARPGRYDHLSYAFIKTSNGLERSYVVPAATTRVIVGSTIGTFLLLVLIVGLCIMYLRKKRDAEGDIEDYLDTLSGMPIRFSYEEMKLATTDFQKKLGQGGFGSVFEGTLVSGEKVAVKRLDAVGQGKKEFLAEVKTIGSIHHINLVRLIGLCAEKFHRLLVYEFMCNGSLDKWIFYRIPLQPVTLTWKTRKAIILDIAKGLAYLHEDCRQRILHLDIKPQNILLDTNLHAKISDFGLSKLIDKDQSQVVTAVRGTPGYLAPEWFNSVVTEKVDVYSFGIVVAEVVCGRKNFDRSQTEESMHLLTLLMKKAEEDRLVDMVDKCSEDMKLHKSEVVEMMKVSLWCLQSDFTKRPSMSMVVKTLLESTMDIEATTAAINTDAALQLSAIAVTSEVLPSFLSGPR